MDEHKNGGRSVYDPGVLVLALDTTRRGGSVGVVRGTAVLSLVDGDESRTHGERLPGEIDLALGKAGVTAHELDLVAVASGPGAFTGLRIGLAAVQGLAMVIGVPVVGVSALDALADAVWQDEPGLERVVTWMDAQRGEIFAASHRREPGSERAERSDPIAAVPAVALAGVILAPGDEVVFAGDGAIRYREVIERVLSRRARVLTTVPALAPSIARLGQVIAGHGGAGPPHTLEPLYVRRPDAELERERQVGP